MTSAYQQVKPPVAAVPFHGTTFHVRAMSFGELAASRKLLAAVGSDKAAVVSVLFCACTADGQRVYGEGDLPAVEALPVPLLVKLDQAAGELLEFSPDPKASAPSTSGPTA